MSEFKTRIEAKKKKLEGELLEAKASAQGATADVIDRLKDRLAKLEDLLSDGWHDLSDDVRERLDKWFHNDEAKKPDDGKS